MSVAGVGRLRLNRGQGARDRIADTGGTADAEAEESGQLRDRSCGAELDGLCEVHDAALNSDVDKVIAKMQVLGSEPLSLRCFAACENQAVPKATFHVVAEQ